jgi:small subunit ribosomal protein S17
MSGKNFEGVVTSNKMTKTLVVSVSRKNREPRTGKIVKSTKKYKVHCEDGAVKSGDRVSFVECRPLSKDKKWRFLKILRAADVLAASTEDEVK